MLNSGLVLDHVLRTLAELRACIESRAERVNVHLVHDSFQILFIFTMEKYLKSVKSGIIYQHCLYL